MRSYPEPHRHCRKLISWLTYNIQHHIHPARSYTVISSEAEGDDQELGNESDQDDGDELISYEDDLGDGIALNDADDLVEKGNLIEDIDLEDEDALVDESNVAGMDDFDD